jgi:amino acid permease
VWLVGNDSFCANWAQFISESANFNVFFFFWLSTAKFKSNWKKKKTNKEIKKERNDGKQPQQQEEVQQRALRNKLIISQHVCTIQSHESQ